MRRSKVKVRFIVNADDFGGSEEINSAILQGIADGVISSTTLMATGPAFESAIRAAKDIPRVSLGAHLNLTQHRPLTLNAGLKPLLRQDGEFRREAVYEVRWTRQLIDAVVEEWSAQVLRIQQSGVEVSHLDSHHHVHTIPGLFLALKRLQRRTGIRRVRGTWTIYDTIHAASSRMRLQKRLWWWTLRHVYATRTTSEFADFLMFQRALAERAYKPRVWPSSIELMVHPNGDQTGNEEEFTGLRRDWLRALPVPAELVSYAAL